MKVVRRLLRSARFQHRRTSRRFARSVHRLVRFHQANKISDSSAVRVTRLVSATRPYRNLLEEDPRYIQATLSFPHRLVRCAEGNDKRKGLKVHVRQVLESLTLYVLHMAITMSRRAPDSGPLTQVRPALASSRARLTKVGVPVRIRSFLYCRDSALRSHSEDDSSQPFNPRGGSLRESITKPPARLERERSELCK